MNEGLLPEQRVAGPPSFDLAKTGGLAMSTQGQRAFDGAGARSRIVRVAFSTGSPRARSPKLKKAPVGRRWETQCRVHAAAGAPWTLRNSSSRARLSAAAACRPVWEVAARSRASKVAPSLRKLAASGSDLSFSSGVFMSWR